MYCSARFSSAACRSSTSCSYRWWSSTCSRRSRCGCPTSFTASERMADAQLNWLRAVDAVDAIRSGAISAEMLAQACIERVRAVDTDVQAWAYFDPAHALAQARAADQKRREGQA